MNTSDDIFGNIIQVTKIHDNFEDDDEYERSENGLVRQVYSSTTLMLTTDEGALYTITRAEDGEILDGPERINFTDKIVDEQYAYKKHLEEKEEE